MVTSIRAFISRNIYSHLLLRISIVYLMFSLCRILFYLFNISYFPGVTCGEFFEILIGGLKFDTTAILYINLLYIVALLLPFPFRHNKVYQRIFTIIFIVFNSVGIFANIADIPYYAFTLKRTTSIVFTQFAHEKNLGNLFLAFVVDYWYATLMFLVLVALFIWLTLKTGLHERKVKNTWVYISTGVVVFVLLGWLIWGGLRGGFRHSTRPITLSNAGEYVSEPSHTAIVLNTPFAIMRTLGKNALPRLNYFDDKMLAKTFNPEHQLNTTAPFARKNVVIFILESYSREFVASLNKGTKIKNYTGYTPFLDSLIGQSLTYKRAFANGKKSIEALPSVLASIPGMEVPYVLSHYSTNNINSLFSLLKTEGYQTGFFHGAPNGSMGFDAFVKMAGVDKYYGKDEYANDADFDGMWGIWDEPFFQFYARTLGAMHEPFCTALFSVSSHHPFAIPPGYEGKLKKGPQPIHQCVSYTDNALRQFFKTASQMPWFKNTVFVITADHATFPCFDECKNNADYFAIPLVIYTPDGSLKGFDSTTVAQQIDIMPTILSYLSFDKPYLAFGKNLLEKPKPNFAINYLNDNYQVFADSMMMETNGKMATRVFNYISDRELQRPLKDSIPELFHFTRAFIQQYNNRMIDNRLVMKIK